VAGVSGRGWDPKTVLVGVPWDLGVLGGVSGAGALSFGTTEVEAFCRAPCTKQRHTYLRMEEGAIGRVCVRRVSVEKETIALFED
jgi:hypothetical protein